MAKVITVLNKSLEDMISKIIDKTDDGMYDWAEVNDCMYCCELKRGEEAKEICVYRDPGKTVLMISAELKTLAWTFTNQIEVINKIVNKEKGELDSSDFEDYMELVYIVPVVTVACGTGAMVDDKETSLTLQLVNAAGRYVYNEKERQKEQEAFMKEQDVRNYVAELEKFI